MLHKYSSQVIYKHMDQYCRFVQAYEFGVLGFYVLKKVL